jgi:hypothetical protein
VGNWQFATGVQHEILPRISVDVSYWRTWFRQHGGHRQPRAEPGRLRYVQHHRAKGSALPGGGGYTITGFSDIKPARFGTPGDEFVTFTKNYGKHVRALERR